MSALDERFGAADGMPVRDLWPEISTRRPSSPPPPPAGRRMLAVALALILAGAAIALVVRAFSGHGARPAGSIVPGKLAFVYEGPGAALLWVCTR